MKCDLKDLAIFLVEFLEDKFNIENENDANYSPKIAAEIENIKFLKFIWEKNIKNNNNFNNENIINNNDKII